jgi:pimeloyl-ACP methyl ester carboxylesterase
VSRFVLVHGSWHGGWVWERVTAILTGAGHEVHAPDLPGRGGDRRDPAAITLTDHVDRIADTVGAPPQSPAIVVGHSFGGFVISHVAERDPANVDLLVYVAGFLLPSGRTVLEVATSVPPVFPYLEVDDPAGLVRVRPEAAAEVFYADCSPADAARSISRLVPEALTPRRTPASMSDAGFGSVRRAYVETLDDRALSIGLQRQMQADLPCDEVVSLPSGHSPFLSMPGRLAETLLRLGAS